MRNVLERAAVAACASAALSATLWAQTTSTDPARRSAPSTAASAAETPTTPTPDAPGMKPPATVQTPSTRPRAPTDRAKPPATVPSNVGRSVDPARADPARATDPSNPVDPAAADPSRPADPTRAREKSPQGDAGDVDAPVVHVAARDATTGDAVGDAPPHALDAASRALAACMRDRDRGVRARCAHDAMTLDGTTGCALP